MNELEVFELYGFVIHEGMQSRKGHYISVVKGLDDIWYRCNDLQITEIGKILPKEETENAYMLFYQKQIIPNLSGPSQSAFSNGSSQGKKILDIRDKSTSLSRNKSKQR